MLQNDTDGLSDNNPGRLLKNDMYSVQISIKNNDNKAELEKIAVENKMAVAYYSLCENILKKYYNISDDKFLLVKNLQFDSFTNLKNLNDDSASDIVSFEYFNPDNGDKLDSKICSNIQTPINLPFKQSARLKMDLYKSAAILKGVVDLYNKESPGYKSRCLKSVEFTTKADTSINYRRTKLYQNESINCSPGCEYEGLDDNSYVKCNCQIEEGNKISNNSTGFDPLFSFPNYNFDIVMCYKETYSDVIKYLIFRKI